MAKSESGTWELPTGTRVHETGAAIRGAPRFSMGLLLAVSGSCDGNGTGRGHRQGWGTG